MALNSEQVAAAWSSLQDSPLIAHWPDFRTQVLPRLDEVTLAGQTAIFGPGDPPAHLFIVGRGSVRQQYGNDRSVWYQQELKPGEFFGQQALYSGEYRSRAYTLEPTTVFLLAPELLKVGVERSPELYESLLRERLAGRLRRIPLFRRNNDDQLRWLAQLMDQVDLPEGASVPFAERPGLYVIDYGQVQVAGPAAFGRQDWRLSAGNFFLSPGASARFGARAVAERAVATQKSRLLWLPADHLDRFMSIFGDAAAILNEPPDLARDLALSPLFASLNERQRRHVAQIAGWEFVPADQTVTTQGSIGHSYIILRDGAALVSAEDDRGRMRPRSALRAGAVYGQSSLLEGKQRDATVRAILAESSDGRPGLPGADVIAVDRRDLAVAFAERPEFWTPDVSLVRRTVNVREVKKPYEWMREDEVLVWQGRPHILALLGPLLLVVLAFLALLLVRLVLPAETGQAFNIILLLISAFGLLPVAVFITVNYRDDYYALTNLRVTRRDRLILVYEARNEAPVDMVQDVTFSAGFWGRLFDYGDVNVRTAAKVGSVVFRMVPHPEQVKQLIMERRTEAVASTHARQQEDLRRSLISSLRLALPVPERTRALGEEAKVPGMLRRIGIFGPRSRGARASYAYIPSPDYRKRLLRSVTRRLPARVQEVLVGTPPQNVQVPKEFVWRKHWLSLVRRAGVPFLLLIGLLVAGFTGALGGIAALVGAAGAGSLTIVWMFLMVCAAAWLAWQWVDYRNDLYVVTDDKIIDIEMKPLGLFAKRREGSLERVQTVDFKQDGIIPNLFNYGDVIIRTAAADEGYDFLMVANPKLVQATVFQKLDALRRRQSEKQATDRRRELVEGLGVYHQLRESNLGRNLPDGGPGPVRRG